MNSMFLIESFVLIQYAQFKTNNHCIYNLTTTKSFDIEVDPSHIISFSLIKIHLIFFQPIQFIILGFRFDSMLDIDLLDSI